MATTPTSTPAPKTNRIGLQVIDYRGRQDDAVRRLRAQRYLRAHHRRDVRDGRLARARRQVQRHRVLIEEPRLFHEPVAQL